MICSHFNDCGGCRFQNLPYSEQLLLKQKEIEALFPKALPILPSDFCFHYRNKMEYTFSMDKQENRFLGLHRKRGRVVDLQECLLVAPWFQAALNQVRKWWKNSSIKAYHPHKNS